MSLLRDVVEALRGQGTPHALIGAAAMAVRGVSRSTADLDLLTVDAGVLHSGPWAPFELRGIPVRILRGDADDPLAGNVRLADGAQIVDVVVGRHVWQREIVEAAVPSPIGDVEIPVAGAGALVLLKLYAGGPKDAWDVRSLLEVSEDEAALRAEVDQGVSRLGADACRLWERLKEQR
jgi:hypothetical protein